MKSAFFFALALSLGGSVLPGCADGAGAGAGDAESSGEGTVIARVELTDAHYVEFRQLADNHVSLTESRNADLEKPVEEALRFDPRKKSFVELYQHLLAASEFPDASDREGDLERLAAVDARFAALAASSAQTGAPTEEAVGKAAQALTRWGNYDTTPGDWNWFSTNYCRSWTDFCEVGYLGSHTQSATQNSAAVTLFNQHATRDDATLRLAWDPCKNAPFWDFCTKPFQTLTTLAAPHRWVTRSSVWSNSDRSDVDWAVYADGSHWGWGLIFDN